MDFQIILELLKKSKDKHRAFNNIQSGISILNSSTIKEAEAKYLATVRGIEFEDEEIEITNGLLRIANESLDAYRKEHDSIMPMKEAMKRAWSMW